MIDIDHFKAVNDAYGHAVGDDCLREVARRLSGAVRGDEDFVARYGGEEFAIVMPDVDRASAQRRAEQLLVEVGGQDIPADHASLRVTISIGLADEDVAGEGTPLELVRRADRALFEAKRTGRDQMCLAGSGRD